MKESIFREIGRAEADRNGLLGNSVEITQILTADLDLRKQGVAGRSIFRARFQLVL